MRARRRFAQHFLQPEWVRKVVDAVGTAPDDLVLEIGPGRGALTVALAPRVRHVTAIELDRDLIAELRDASIPNLDIVEGDVLRVDLADTLREVARRYGPGRLRVVGNLPYNISSPILARLVRLSQAMTDLRDATIMLQREVADRVASEPGGGDWGPLGIAVQLHADVVRLLAIPPGAFRPAPRVHSAVLQLRFRPPRVTIVDPSLFDSMTRAVFGQRRKTLSNALRPFATGRGQDSARLLHDSGIDPRRRPETLSIGEFARLANVAAGSAAPSAASPAGGLSNPPD